MHTSLPANAMRRYFFKLLLLILALLFHTTSSTVYYVIPDDHYTTNNNTYTLQHYLNNINKYFTSHTQLHFLPGQYYLNTDLIIQHVSNLSLIGKRTDEIINSVIKCTSPAGIIVVGSSNLVIANFVMKECGNHKNFPPDFYYYKMYGNENRFTSLLVLHCKYITITHLSLVNYDPDYMYGLRFANVIGSVMKLQSNFLVVRYDESTDSNDTHFLNVSDCWFYIAPYISNMKHALEIQQNNASYNSTILIKHCRFVARLAVINICIGCSGYSIITFSFCYFAYKHKENLNYDTRQYGYYSDDSWHYRYYKFNEIDHDQEYTEKCAMFLPPFKMILNHYKNCYRQAPNQLKFLHCSFYNTYSRVQTISFYMYTNTYDREVGNTLLISIENCTFNSNRSSSIISACQYSSKVKTHMEHLEIKNTTLRYFLRIPKQQETTVFTISVKGMKVYLENVLISNSPAVMTLFGNIIIDALNSHLMISKYLEISKNTAYCAIQATKMHVTENTIVNITNNTFLTLFNDSHHKTDEMNDCFIQYTSSRGNLDDDFQHKVQLKYSMVFTKNKIFANKINANFKHCRWDSYSAFWTSSPLKVNQKFVNYDNVTLVQYTGQRHICLCNNATIRNCKQESIGPVYPGQLIKLSFSLSKVSKGSVRFEKAVNSDFACKSYKNNNSFPLNSKILQLNKNECTHVSYIFSHKNGKWCELIIAIDPLFHGSKSWIEMYTIFLKPCPPGFSLHPQGYCQCDPILSSHMPSLTTCDIDHQTIATTSC